MLLATKNNVPSARQSFERALQLSPGFLPALGGLTYLDLSTKNFAQSISRLEAEIAKQPGNGALYVMLAQSFRGVGDSAKEEQTLRRAVSADPRMMEGYGLLAEFYLRHKRTDEARAEFEGIVKREPSNVGARTMVAVLLEQQGKADEARKTYETMANDAQNAPVAANNLAYIYAEQGINLDTALQLAQTAKQRLPDNPSVDDTIGWIYYKKDLPALAVKPFEESLKKRPDSAEVLFHLGLTYAKLGEKAKAKETLERALKLDPKVGGEEARRVLQTVTQ
jgi:tetratricopeptide (TPR) repeat protein